MPEIIARQITGSLDYPNMEDVPDGSRIKFDPMQTLVDTVSGVIVLDRPKYARVDGTDLVKDESPLEPFELYTVDGGTANYKVRLPDGKRYTVSLPGDDITPIQLADLLVIPAQDSVNNLNFDDLTDVDIPAPTNGQVVVYDTPSRKWVAEDAATVAIPNLQDILDDALSTKQDTLVSGVNIKTVNGGTILGAGDLAVSGGDAHLNGYGSLDLAIAGIGAGNAYLFVKQDLTVSANTTVPKNISLVVRDGAVITVNGGAVLTINSFVDPGNRQVFNAVAGGVLFTEGAVEKINVAWWCGSDAANVTAAEFTSAMNSALATVNFNDDQGGVVYVPSGEWKSNGGHLVYKHTVIQGSSNESTEIELMTAGVALFKLVDGDVAPLSGQNRFTGMRLDCAGLAGTIGIHLDNNGTVTNQYQVSFDHLGVWNFETGIYLDGGASNGQFAHVHIDRTTTISCPGTVLPGSKCVHLNSQNMSVTIDAYMFAGYNGDCVYIEKAGTVSLRGNEISSANPSYGVRQEIKQTVVAPAGITGSGNAKCVVTGASVPNSPVTVTFPVTTTEHTTAALIANAAIIALGRNTSVRHACMIGGSSDYIVLDYLDELANDPTFNITIENDTCAGITNDLVAVQVRAGAAPGASHGNAAVHVAGPYNSLHMFGTQDEGLRYSLLFNLSAYVGYSMRFTADNCLLQSAVKFNKPTNAMFRNCESTMPQVLRGPDNIAADYGSEIYVDNFYVNRPFYFDGGASDTIPLISNFGLLSGGATGQRPKLIGDRFWSGDEAFTDPGRVSQNEPTTWYTDEGDPAPDRAAFRFLSHTEKDILTVGNCYLNTGEPTFYHSFRRNWTDGSLRLRGSQGRPYQGFVVEDGHVKADYFDISSIHAATFIGLDATMDLSVSDVFSVTPADSITMYTSNAAQHSNVRIVRLLLTTSGTTPRTVFFTGTGFAAGTPSFDTGNVSGKRYLFTFINVAGTLYEIDRHEVGNQKPVGFNGADIASAATLNLDSATGDFVDVTGTTGITAVTLGANRGQWVRFTGALTLTHGASLVLPTAANIDTEAGDFALFRGYAAGVVRCVAYHRADGEALAGGGGGASSPLTLTASAASELPLTIQLAAAQTADALTVLNSAAAKVFFVDSAGLVRGNTTLGAQYLQQTSSGTKLQTTHTNLVEMDNGNFVKLRGAGGVEFTATGSYFYGSGGYFGRDGVAAMEGVFTKAPVAAKTANYAVVTTESNKPFTNEGAGAKRDFTLPAAAVGLTYTFFVQNAVGLRVVAAAGDTIRIGGSVSAAAGNIDSTTVGSAVRLTALNATEWFAEYSVGTWTVT